MPPIAAGLRPRTHPALTPRRRPDRPICRPMLPAYARALTQSSHLAVARTDRFAAQCCRSAAGELTQRLHLVAAQTI